MRNALRCLLVASCSFVGALAWAHEPIITSVTGHVADGRSMEIHGNNFGFKYPIDVLKWDRFNDGPENGPIGNGDGRGNDWYSADQVNVTGPYYDAANPRGPHDVYQLRWAFETRYSVDATQWWGLEANNIGRMGYMDFWFLNAGADIDPRRVQMWSFHETSSIGPGPGGGVKAYETILFPYPPANAVWINTGYYLCRDYAPHPIFLKDNYFWYGRPDKYWHKIAVQWVDFPGSGSTLGQYKVWLDEQLVADITGNLQGCGGVGVPPVDLDWITFYHWVRNGCEPGVLYPEPSAPTDEWFHSCEENRPEMKTVMDDVYIDDQWSRVVICDSKEWVSRKHCETQIVKDWDNTNQNLITVAGAQGEFEDGKTAWVYVIHQAYDIQGHYTTHVNGKGFAVTWE